MRTIPYWIQRADFTATEHDAVDSARAVQIVKTHDWQGEWRLLAARETAGQETCSPGVGFMAASGRILHICPSPDGPALVHYHFSEPKRRLGFIPGSATEVRSNPTVGLLELAEFVERFYEDDHAWLVERTTAV
jgi:hypothetical protein